MSGKPSYIVNEVRERDVTVDWLFGRGHVGTSVAQVALLLVGWFFTILPVVVTASALLHRDDAGGWWNYAEGFARWDSTIYWLGILLVIFVVGFLVLHVLHVLTLARRNLRETFDAQRLAKRLEIADAWYAAKFGPEPLRLQERRVRIGPYDDIETYELRGLYRDGGVD